MKSENIKIVEIRDRGTLIPALAIRILPSNETELFLFKHCGYGFRHTCIMLVPIEAPWHSARSSDEWSDRSARTMATAHKWIEENFDNIENCQVVDVEFILKEKEKPCKSFIFEELNNLPFSIKDENE
jgi:hypothetical protein